MENHSPPWKRFTPHQQSHHNFERCKPLYSFVLSNTCKEIDSKAYLTLPYLTSRKGMETHRASSVNLAKLARKQRISLISCQVTELSVEHSMRLCSVIGPLLLCLNCRCIEQFMPDIHGIWELGLLPNFFKKRKKICGTLFYLVLKLFIELNV